MEGLLSGRLVYRGRQAGAFGEHYEHLRKHSNVIIFEGMPKGSCFVGGEPHDKFVRFKVDQIARTVPGPVLREWWIKALDKAVAPYVKDRGCD